VGKLRPAGEVAGSLRLPCVVYASTIAVLGALPQAPVGDDTLPVPTTSAVSQKLMNEIMIGDLTRRGRIDGRAVRLPGVVARPRQPSGLGSAFLSELFHAVAAGEAITLPVGADASSWLMSVECVVDNLLHAASIPECQLHLRRAWTLPALRLRMADLAAAIALACSQPNTGAYAPDKRIEALFGRNPPLETPLADTLGFQHDGTAERLIQRCLAEVCVLP
jgi:nucleoside-diphosphate-sugar epimerase